MLEINPFMESHSPAKVKSSCCVNSRNFHLDENRAGIYLFKVNNGNTRALCEIYSKLTIKTPERRQWRSGVFIINFEQISHIAMVFS